jgi:hypothetical protein
MYGQLPLLEQRYQMKEDDQFEDEITTQVQPTSSTRNLHGRGGLAMMRLKKGPTITKLL